ncbi:mitochondrial import receptor subunit TOM22 homolog [Palaemon carinicauda]|uniref:mitochondrial import receptor subunit TOM22 homolog n=1 Tax=Palaemon carinicauda TaxID=392227 RepID=UPI0035B5B0A5
MATLTEVVDLDSGVASSEATPEGQTVIPSAAEEASKMALEGEEILQVSKETPVEEEKPKDAPAGKESNDVAPKDSTVAVTSKVVPAASVPADDDEEEEDEDVDESFGERLLALTEMFPDSLRSASSSAVSTSVSLLKSSYSLTRQVVWVAVSTSIILFAPVMFELERLNVEEMMKQDRNRLVLGPGSAMSGAPPTPGGLMPPPPR